MSTIHEHYQKRGTPLSTQKASNRTTPTNSQHQRLTLGLAADDIVLVGGQNALLGVADVAQERNVNLLCFHQRLSLRDAQTPAEIGPATWDSLGEVVDGLVLYQSWPDEATFTAFRNSFPALPMVNTLRIYTGCPAVAPDFYHGLKELTCHLIEVHGYRRIAFINGPDIWSISERYRGYVDALAEHGLSPDPNLVTPPRGWLEAEQGAIPLLLDERGLRPGIDFEAIVASNDAIALNVLDDLQKRDVQVPAQVAVSGFDGDSRSSCATPPLTTTQLPAYQIGRRAAEIVLAQLAGEPVPEQTLVPTQMMLRQSCGCMAPAVTQAAVGVVTDHRQTLDSLLAASRPQIVAEMQQVVGKNGATPHRAEQLLDGFVAELAGESPGRFIHELDQVLRQVVAAGAEIQPWQNTLSVLRRCLVPHLDDEKSILAGDLWQQGRVMIGETAERVQVSRRVQADQRANQLREVTQTLITTFNVKGLMDVLATELPGLGIPGCYLSLYEQHAAPVVSKPEYSSAAPEWSRLILAYNETGREVLPPAGRRFSSSKLIPEQLWPQDRAYSLVVEPLYFQDDQLGFVLFEMGPREGSMYKTLRGQISSALYGALLWRERQRAETALEKAYLAVEQQVQERTAQLQREIAEREQAQAESARLQQEVIAAQQAMIQELSTPVIPALPGILIMPLIGSIDSLRARDLTRALLAGITRHKAKVVILDVTGVSLIDSGVANHLNKTIQAARLKGVRTIVTGISETVAETIVDLGLDWSAIETTADLQTGLHAVLASQKSRGK